MSSFIPGKPMVSRQMTFSKSDRLYLRDDIARVFSKGRAINLFPIKAVCFTLQGNDKHPLKAGFAVPKRNFRKAVDRNRIKRLMKEAWRIHKNECGDLLGSAGKEVHLMIMYQGGEQPVYKDVEDKIILLLQRLRKLHE